MFDSASRALLEGIHITAVANVLDHFWREQLRDYADCPGENHVFTYLVTVANWINNTEASTPEDYVRACEANPGADWRDGGKLEQVKPPGEGNVSGGVREHPSTPAWKYLGSDSRYRLAGFSPNVRVILGWDRPMGTYFAQVWRVCPDIECEEDGLLLLWLGTSSGEWVNLDDMAVRLNVYAVIPQDLKTELACDQEHGWEACRNRRERR